MTIVAHATEGTSQTEQLWTAGAAAARMSGLYAAVWCAVAIGLVYFDGGCGAALLLRQPRCNRRRRKGAKAECADVSASSLASVRERSLSVTR